VEGQTQTQNGGAREPQNYTPLAICKMGQKEKEKRKKPEGLQSNQVGSTGTAKKSKGGTRQMGNSNTTE